MKQIIILFIILEIIGCSRKKERVQDLSYRIDSLEKSLSQTYKPGFGEFMSFIQAHHAKLWFAGQNHNWALAKFEVQEIQEAMEDIKKYQKEREESRLIDMINPAIDSVALAIEQKNPALFNHTYSSLTNTCNACHRDANFAFNVVKIPDKQTFSNQDFKTHP
jgi:hypothetical protein